MAKVRNQLQIVIDQLTLDKATGSYLNTISGNYGLERPSLGFSDAQWRAAAKLLALQYKQITNKFRDILTLMLGPQKTLVANLSVSIPVGSFKVPVFSTVGLPQAGTLTLDTGLTTAETLEYKFIDYESNVIVLTLPTQFAHNAVLQDAESILVSCSASSSLAVVVNSERFPQDFSGGKRYPIVLGRGTILEETVDLYGNDVATGHLTITPAQFTHVLPLPLPGVAYTTKAYSTASFSLYIDDLGLLPNEGVIRLGLTPPRLVQFTSRNLVDNTVNLKYTIPVAVPVGTVVEVIPATSTALLGEVQVAGIGWDVIQSTPRKVEILIPRQENVQDLRTASYLHDLFDDHSTSLDANLPASSTQADVAATSMWPIAGTVVIHTGVSIGFDAEYVGYSLPSDDSGNMLMNFPHGTVNPHSASDNVEFYSPTYAELGRGDIESGDIHGSKLYPFPGPYVYNPDELSPKANVATTLAENFAAPSILGIDANVSAGPAVIEVAEGAGFPISGTYPIIIGDETLTVTRYSPFPVVTFSGVVSSGTTLHINPGEITTSKLPLVGGFRMIVKSPNDSPAKNEIVWVTAVDPGANTITIETALQTSRFGGGLGAYVAALGDLVTVTQVDEFHKGTIAYANRAPVRTTRSPINELPVQTTDVETVIVPYSSIDLAVGTGFSTTGGGLDISFGLAKHEDFSYSSRTGVTLNFASPVTPTKTHLSGDPVNYAPHNSDPVNTGYDFPLRVPVDEFDNIKFLLNLVRAAGVEVDFIYKR